MEQKKSRMINTDDISTPFLAINKEIFEKNIIKANEIFSNSGKFLRPHFKTHRTPELLRMQMGRFTNGVTCSTVGEAEVAVSAGINNILIANTFATPSKIRRIASLAKKANITVAIDSEQHLNLLTATNATINVLLEIDIGLHRCGVSEEKQIIKLAHLAKETTGVNFAGIMGYEGRIRKSSDDRENNIRKAYSLLAHAKHIIEKEGIKVESVSAAGTSTLFESIADRDITEIQAGTYALMEPEVMDLGLPFELAVYIVGTVISTASGYVILDSGRRSVSYENGLPVCLHTSGKVIKLNDEHAILEWNGVLPQLGYRIALRPTQNRTTFNLHDSVWLIDRNNMAEKLNITARGLSY